MSQTWTVMIKGNPPASFTPDAFAEPPLKPGDPVKAQAQDLVCWNNQTSDAHQIEVTLGSSPFFTTKEIEAFKSSNPGYVIPQGTPVATIIAYHCTLHLDKDKRPTEKGTITVVGS
jgi:hypothetical protein